MLKRKRGRSSPPSANPTSRTRRRKQTPSPDPIPEKLSYNIKQDSIFRGVLERDTDRINLGIDFGTSCCAAYFAIVPKNTTDLLKVKPEKLDLQRAVSVLPSFVALRSIHGTNDAELIFGQEINQATEHGEASISDVWIDLKQSDFLVNMKELSEEKRKTVKELHQQHKKILRDARKYRKIFLNHGWTEKKEVVELDTMEDVVESLLRYFLMEVKSALQLKSVLSKAVIDALVSGRKGRAYGDRLRVGVAVPEVWTWQRMVIYRCFRNAGFHQDLELLSEGRCALTKDLRGVLEQQMQREDKNKSRLIEELKQSVFLGIDDGGYTLDGAIMELVQDGSLVKLAVVGQGCSSQNGSNRANDIFKSRVKGYFGPEKLPAILKHLDVEEGDLMLKFERGFVAAKCSLGRTDQGSVRIGYHGLGSMQSNKSDHATWAGRVLRIKRKAFVGCLEEAIEEKFADSGPIRSLLDQAVTIANGRRIHAIFSGGGSKSMLFHDRAIKDLAALGVQISFDGTGSASCVAEGACIALSDSDLCRNVKESRKSYGIVVTEEFDSNNAVHKMRIAEKMAMLPHSSQKDVAGREDLPHTVAWKVKLNEDVRHEKEKVSMQQTIWTDNDGRDEPKDNPDGWTFELELVETSNPTVGSQDGHSANHPAIVTSGVLRIHINKELAAFIGRAKGDSKRRSYGFCQGDDGLWRLDFDYILTHQWRGMLQYFKVKIPKGGALDNDDIGEKQSSDSWDFWEKADWKTADEKWDSMRGTSR